MYRRIPSKDIAKFLSEFITGGRIEASIGASILSEVDPNCNRK